MFDTTAVKTVGIVGAGVIGAGWAVRNLAHGHTVLAYDPAADYQDKLLGFIANAVPALEKQGFAMHDWQSRLKFASSVQALAQEADIIQENAPEREELKQALLQELDANAKAGTLIASSSSGLLPSRLQAGCQHPERIFIAHPFNPVYLLPLVELVPGSATAAEAITAGQEFYQKIGMRPLIVRREIEGYIADRLMEALWREALHLVNDDIATTEEVDAAVVYGAGLRWALMGTFLTFHLAGGESGMRHMLEQFGPALELPWTHTKAPKLTDELIDKVVAGCEHQAAGRGINALAQRRDDFLVRLLALVEEYWPENEGLKGHI